MKLLLIFSMLCINKPSPTQTEAKKKVEQKKATAKKPVKKLKATTSLWPSILIVDTY